MALNNVEKKVGVTVNVDASGALKAWKAYERAQEKARESTKKFGEGLEVSNARIQNQREALQRATATFTKAEAARQKAMASAASSFSGFAKGATMAAGALGGAMGLVGVVGMATSALSGLADESLRVQNVFGNLPYSIAPARKATHGFVDDLQLATSANQAAALGVATSSHEFAKLAGAAQALGQKLNLDTTTAFDSLVAGVGRGSAMMLDNLGIIVKKEAAYDRYAAQLGTTASALDDVQRAEAFRKAALEAIFKAAEEVTVVTDGAAAATKRYATELSNLKTAALGGEDRVTSLRDGFARLEETQSIATLGLHGQRMEFGKLRDALVAAGVETDKVAKLSNRDLAEGIENARHEAEQQMLTLASEGRLTKDYRGELERVVDRMGAASLTAQTLGRALENMRVAEAAQQMADLNAQLNIQIGLQAALDNAAMVDAEIGFKPGKGKGGGKRDRFAAERSAFQTALADSQRQAGFERFAGGPDAMLARGEFAGQLNAAQQAQQMKEAARAMGMARVEGEREANLLLLEERRRALEIEIAEGLDPVTAINRQETATVEFHQRELEMLRSHHAQRGQLLAQEQAIAEAHHRANLQRLQAEQEARQKSIAAMVGGIGVFDGVQQKSFALGLESLAGLEMSEKRKAQIANRALGVQAFGVAAMQQVLAAAAFASLNPIQGAAHQAAAILAATKGGLLMSGAIGPQAGLGDTKPGGSSYDFRPGGPGWEKGGSGGGGGGSAIQFTDGRRSSSQSAPISRAGSQHTPPGASGGGGVVVHATFNSTLPADEEKAGVQLAKMIRHAQQSFGSTD